MKCQTTVNIFFTQTKEDFIPLENHKGIKTCQYTKLHQKVKIVLTNQKLKPTVITVEKYTPNATFQIKVKIDLG